MMVNENNLAIKDTCDPRFWIQQCDSFEIFVNKVYA